MRTDQPIREEDRTAADQIEFNIEEGKRVLVFGSTPLKKTKPIVLKRTIKPVYSPGEVVQFAAVDSGLGRTSPGLGNQRLVERSDISRLAESRLGQT